MHYVYILKSINHPDQIYIGHTEDFEKRLIQHNNGNTFHTAKYKPWEMIAYIGLKDEFTAISFEKYLKSGTGRAFISKRLLK